jgi:hypothetical protein
MSTAQIVSDNPVSFEVSTVTTAPCIYCGRETIYYCEDCGQRMCEPCSPTDTCPDCEAAQYDADKARLNAAWNVTP